MRHQERLKRIFTRCSAPAITLRRDGQDDGWGNEVYVEVSASIPAQNASIRFSSYTDFFIYAQKRIPLRNSGLFNDYMFYLKNSGDMADALRQITSDKVYAKLFIDQIVDRKVTPETYAVFTSANEIRRSELPDRCVLKPAHTSGTIVFLEDPDADISEADYEKLRRAVAPTFTESLGR